MDPAVIKKLDESVINRIAAGEIIQRPANALKEMLENSLDAKSSFIQISVKGGGLKFMQIQDNGTGIRKSDMEIVCERFTTSKLEKFEDLSNMSTFGFRGEALASISHVAHLSIQTKTRDEKCAYKASYVDGKLKGPPKPCAGNQGTIITVEDLFYNMPQRKQGFKSPSEEFQKVSDVVSKYAIHNASVGFVLKKCTEQPTIRTPANSSQEKNIKLIFGADIAKELMPIEMEDQVHRVKLEGFITKVNYSAKKGTMLIFINHRLVESTALKASIDSVYNAYLPKGNHPFIYLSLQLDPNNVDVNVHPTKHEVHFLYEDEIIEKIKENLEMKLIGCNSTRTFYKQLKLPGATNILDDSDTNITSSSERVQPKDFVRTDSKEQKLEKFWIASRNTVKSRIEQDDNNAGPSTSTNQSKEIKLTSVLSMRRQIENAASSKMNEILKSMVFVGVVNKTFALVQFETKLILCNTKKLSSELFYQNLVYNFGNLKNIRIEPPLLVRDLLKISMEMESSGWTEEDGPKEELAERALEILLSKSAIMREYFSLHITDKGMLESLPSLVENHLPSMTYLPQFLLRLATEVDWETEEQCFESFCRETAYYYSMVPQIEKDTKQRKWIVEYCIYPCLKRTLIAVKKLEKDIFELTNLPSLYKVFERC